MVSGWVCFDLLGLVPILGMIVPNLGIFKDKFPIATGVGREMTKLSA
jgi:hypothetical protein